MCVPKIIKVLSTFITEDSRFHHLLNIQMHAVTEMYQQLRALEILLTDVSGDEQISAIRQRISVSIRRLQDTDRNISAVMELIAARQVESYDLANDSN